jgi:hypothetical protein
MEEIKLTRGFVALVDDEDYEYINQWKWCVTECKGRRYATRAYKENGKNHYLFLHRVIMQTPINLVVDHMDHNGLNCQKHNMRNCTRKQNLQNKLPQKNSSSKYLGVSYSKEMKKFRADINDVFLGYFPDELDAAKAYDAKALETYGEYANLNFK